jgi:hypothetical protein
MPSHTVDVFRHAAWIATLDAKRTGGAIYRHGFVRNSLVCVLVD